MTKKAMIAWLLGCVCLVTACAAQPISASPTIISTTQEQASALPEQSTAPPKAETKTASGTVWDASMSSLVLETEDGKTDSFQTDGAQMELGDSGLAIGATVQVVYVERDGVMQAQTVTLIRPASALGFASHRERAQEILSGMTTEEKAGQMFIVRCPQDAREQAEEYQFGGYILFDRDFKGKTPEDVRGDVESYQEASKIAMLIGVDEEGGTVKRISRYEAFREEPFRSPQALYNDGGFDLIRSDTAEKDALLKKLGINVNLAPVCDVSTDPDDFIYPRAFGGDAQQTSQYVQTVVTQMKEDGTGCTLKHFPGYGSNTDTHTGIARDTRSYDSFVASDFLPFMAGIEAGAESVLVCHNIVESMDADLPASLSPKAHSILREELGFEGVIMTDDLYMDAIREEYGTADAAVKAISAGNDLLISTEYEEQVDAVLQAVKDGTLKEERIDESVLRILCWKLALGIIS